MTTDLTPLFRTLTKAERNEFVHDIKTNILEGYVDPLQIEIMLKSAEETIKALRTDPEIRECVLSELEKHGKTANIYGAELTRTDKKTWDYSGCGDSKWTAMNEILQATKEDIKDREKFLQSIPESGMADPETGEMIRRANYTVQNVLTIKIK